MGRRVGNAQNLHNRLHKLSQQQKLHVVPASTTRDCIARVAGHADTPSCRRRSTHRMSHVFMFIALQLPPDDYSILTAGVVLVRFLCQHEQKRVAKAEQAHRIVNGGPHIEHARDGRARLFWRFALFVVTCDEFPARAESQLFRLAVLIRKAQAVKLDDATMKALRKHELLDFKVAGVFDPAVVVAGFVGGMGRGVVEGPFEFVKVRRQLDKPWSLSSVYKGSSATMVRNAFLFGSFVVYIDLSKQAVDGGLGPFWTGAVCSNLAWLTIWPLDVVKVRVLWGVNGRSRVPGMGQTRVAKHVDRSQKEAAAALAVSGGGG